MSTSPETPALAVAIRENAKLTKMAGWILVIAGLFALMSPFVAGLSLTIMIGASLVVGAIGQCYLAFKAGAFGRALMMLVMGILMLAVGGFMISQPVAGLASITLMLVAYFIAAGATELFVGLQLRPADGWKLEVFNGIVTLLLGLVLWSKWPISGAWAVGVLFGIKMVFSGWALVLISGAAKQVATEVESVDASNQE